MTPNQRSSLQTIIAASIANARGGRRGVPEISNILELLPGKLREEVMDDADAVLERIGYLIDVQLMNRLAS